MKDFILTEADRRTLIALVRHTIAAELRLPTAAVVFNSETLKQIFGVFVSVSVQRRLRGCIGIIEGREPLADEVPRLAAAAAFADPRFPPISAREFDDMRVEISVLSPLRPIDGPADIRVGTDGLVVQRGENRGLLLPQVAAERDWGAETFLGYTCDKAGLAEDAWRDPATEMWAFTATVVEELD